MADDTITKRIIVSGLTPAITVDDINRRLSSFGSVKAIDGFGLVDGLGQPRKFGYVTLETTPSKLGKCMNVLSGSVWKGAKLRLGEAKPDYKERIARENQDAVEEPAKKRRRFDAVHSDDMSLVTAENVSQRQGWTVSPLGRITYPLKIQPTRPLTLSESKSNHSSADKGSGKKKKRIKKDDIRARNVIIDMRKWGSTHLKGNFLDSFSVPTNTGRSVDHEEVKDGSELSTTDDDDETAIPLNVSSEANATLSQDSDSDLLTMGDEKAQTLNLLSTLFGKSNEEGDWIGRESVSDVEMGELEIPVSDDNHGFEEMPGQPSPQIVTQNETAANTGTKLKDLFAPREEAPFSLLDHLELDIALDEDVSFPHETMAVLPEPSQEQAMRRTSHGQTIMLNPKQALFFSTKAPYWRDPAVRFWNTESEEEIKQRWEACRGELTKDWKERWKKARRRRISCDNIN